MKAFAIVLLAISPAALWHRVWQETNSYASAHRGKAQYGAQHFEQAAKSFGDSDRLSPSPRSAFNLGTAQVAAGKMTEGSATLSRALKDPSLRADTYFNRGNSALKSKAYEYAIRDYVETLKLRPEDAGAKRNLEIALEQLQQQKRAASGGRQGKPQPSPSQQPQQNQKAPSAAEKEDQQQSDAEALLRSVQQQEQEELQRMKRARGESVRVGW